MEQQQAEQLIAIYCNKLPLEAINVIKEKNTDDGLQHSQHYLSSSKRSYHIHPIVSSCRFVRHRQDLYWRHRTRHHQAPNMWRLWYLVAY